MLTGNSINIYFLIQPKYTSFDPKPEAEDTSVGGSSLTLSRPGVPSSLGALINQVDGGRSPF